MLNREDEADEIDDDKVEAQTLMDACDEIEIIDALELADVKSKDELAEIEYNLIKILTDEYYEKIAEYFLTHCGSVKKRDELKEQLINYFKNLNKD